MVIRVAFSFVLEKGRLREEFQRGCQKRHLRVPRAGGKASRVHICVQVYSSTGVDFGLQTPFQKNNAYNIGLLVT